MNEIAKDFLARCFAPDSTIAILLRREVIPPKTQQRVVTLEQVLAPRYLGWLAHENHNGANIYVAANPLRSGSRKRTKDSIDSVRHLYIDIDSDGDTQLAALRTADEVPAISAVLFTSPGKYQILWRVEGFDFEQQEITLKRLAIAFGGDPACTDRNRVLRIPGFLNRKYSPAYYVAVEYGDNRVWTPTDFHLEKITVSASFPLRDSARAASHKDTRSEQDWSWVCLQLMEGKDAGKLTQELASRRSDKPNPLYYAQRTVDVASARHCFLEGASIDHVITMLIQRRRYELPDALCSVRAREIACTAQRMIARKKIA